MAVEAINIKIGKMACNICLTNVKEALSKLDSIKTCERSLNDSNTKIGYDSDKITKDDMKKAIEDAGYEYLGEV